MLLFLKLAVFLISTQKLNSEKTCAERLFNIPVGKNLSTDAGLTKKLKILIYNRVLISASCTILHLQSTLFLEDWQHVYI